MSKTVPVYVFKLVDGNEIIAELLAIKDGDYMIHYPIILDTMFDGDKPVTHMSLWMNHSKEQDFLLKKESVSVAPFDPLDAVLEAYYMTVKHYVDGTEEPSIEETSSSETKTKLIPNRILH